MRNSTFALFTIPMATTAPAHAATFESYEGINGMQKKLCSVDTALHTVGRPTWSLNLQQFGGDPMPPAPFVFWQPAGWNDETRSMHGTSKWRNRSEHRRARLTVFDNLNGSKKDDYLHVVVNNVRNIPDRGVCVRPLENNFNHGGVRSVRFAQNGIDDKISRAETLCDSSCVADKVGPR